MQSNISCTDITRVSYVILDHVSTFGHFQLNRKLHKFHLFDMNSKLTDNKLHHLLLTDKIGKNIHFREINISVKTTEFIISIFPFEIFEYAP